MSLSLPLHVHSSGQQEVRPNLPLPMVYEHVPVEPMRWEYRVLTFDTREETLPDTIRLNELGNEGWLLVGILAQKAPGENGPVNYYFVRQRGE